jgi:hypothetical protein
MCGEFDTQWNELTADWYKLRNEETRVLHTPPNIIKETRMVRMGKGKSAYKILLRKLQKRSLQSLNVAGIKQFTTAFKGTRIGVRGLEWFGSG